MKSSKRYKFKTNTDWYPQIFYTEKRLYTHFNNIGADKEDIVIFIDGSFSKKGVVFNNIAGAGIVVYYQDQRYEYARPLGETEILYAEQFALAQSFYLLKKLKIPTWKKRIIICTDNETTFKGVYSIRKIPTYPKLMMEIKKQMFQRLDQAQVLLHKVKAHTNIIIKGNDFADKCAKTGRIHSSILWTETPSDPNCFLGSLCDYYTRCSHRMLLWHPSRGVD